jgi:hypothetical protein
VRRGATRDQSASPRCVAQTVCILEGAGWPREEWAGVGARTLRRCGAMRRYAHDALERGHDGVVRRHQHISFTVFD